MKLRVLVAQIGLLVGCLLPQSFAQTPMSSLTGRVLDAKTGEPLPFATVYLNNTAQGTNADQDGVYRLSAVPLGNQEVIGSFLGYQTARVPLRLIDTRPRTLDLTLEPAGQSLASVTVRARHDKTWVRSFNRFSRELLGDRPQARQCRITNPNVLSFQDEKGHLRVQASEPLVIENAALGYRLYYNLMYFDLYQEKMQFAGTSRFEELTPTDARQKARWQVNRVAAYQGSIQHLLASLLAGTHEQAGYRVYRSPLTDEGINRVMPFVRTRERRYIDASTAATLLKAGGLSFERQLTSDQPLEVYYNRVYAANSPYHDSPDAYSLLLLPQGSLTVNTNGWITASNGLDVRGYMGNDRLATLLPADWNPPTSELLLAGSVQSGRVGRADAGLDSLVRLRKRQAERTAPLVYLHTDKSFYLIGDQLWLSAYVLDATRQLPIASRPGSTLQVELIAPSGQPVQHQWLALIDGRASARFRLADSLPAGTYQLRALTTLDPSADNPAFTCSFPVYRVESEESSTPAGSISSTPTQPTRPTRVGDSLDVQFLPEGGRWLAGITSRIGVKVVAPDGRGRAVRGRILDQTDAEVARFSTSGLGLGQLTLTPRTGYRYRALIEVDKRPQTIALPAVESEGYALSVDAVSDSSRLTVRVRATGRYSQQPVYVSLQCREQLVYHQVWLLTSGEAQFSLATASLPPGVGRLTLWDADRQARAERLVFVSQRTEPFQMRVTTNKVRYTPREQVALGFQLRDAEGNPIQGSWSAAVTDADQLPLDTNRADLPTYLLLTAGLRGWIEAPAYYLQPTHEADLDNLLLTQGWRRLPAASADSTGGWSLSGRVKNRQGQPIGGQSVVVVLEQGDQKLLHTLLTDAQGVFRLTGLLIRDTVTVRAGVVGPGRNGTTLTLDQPGSRRLPATGSIPLWQPRPGEVADARQRHLAWPAFYRDSTARQLAEVVVRAQKPLATERPRDVERSSLHGAADNVLIVEPGSVFTSMGDLLMRMPGYSQLVARNYSSFGDNAPLYLVDGVYMDAYTVSTRLSPAEISRVEILRNPTTAGIYGARAANGIIAIYTRKEASPVKELPTSVTTTLAGLASPREFYVPRYAPPVANLALDRRDVLYWQAIGETDENGSGRLVFPLSDTAKRLRIRLQGITNEGAPMSFTWELPVR